MERPSADLRGSRRRFVRSATRATSGARPWFALQASPDPGNATILTGTIIGSSLGAGTAMGRAERTEEAHASDRGASTNT
jgi:hypothetical protein